MIYYRNDRKFIVNNNDDVKVLRGSGAKFTVTSINSTFNTLYLTDVQGDKFTSGETLVHYNTDNQTRTVVTNTTVNGLKSLTDEIGRLSRSFGVSSTELLEVSRTLSQAGLSANETRKALEALAKSSLAPTFNDIRNTTEGVVAIMSQFGIRARDMEKVLGSLNAVAGKFAVEAEDLISVVRRTGGEDGGHTAGG